MKTEFFQATGLTATTKKQIKVLASISQESVIKIVNWLQDKQYYPRFDRDDVVSISKITGESGDVLVDALSALKLFIDKVLECDGNVNDFYADLKELKIIDEAVGYKTLDALFSRFPIVIERFLLFRRKKLTEQKGSPSLTGSSMTAIAKPVFAKSFAYGKDALEKYRPIPISHTVVGLIELKSSGAEDTFSFQMNSDSFDRFIADLLALQAEMKVLESEIKKIQI